MLYTFKDITKRNFDLIIWLLENLITYKININNNLYVYKSVYNMTFLILVLRRCLHNVVFKLEIQKGMKCKSNINETMLPTMQILYFCCFPWEQKMFLTIRTFISIFWHPESKSKSSIKHNDVKLDTMNYTKKPGFNLYQLRHCAYITYSVKTWFLKNLSVFKKSWTSPC